MGCGSSSTSHNDSTHHNNDIDSETVDMRKTSMTGGYGMDFFGEMNNELETDINAIMKVENEVKMRDEQRRNCEITFKKFDANGNGKLEPIEIRAALIELGLELPKSQLEEYVTHVMKIYDDNSDGFLRIHEFEKFYSTCMATEALREKYLEKIISNFSADSCMRDLAKHAFDKYDEDKSGTLDITELAEVLLHLLPLHNSDLTEEQWVDLIKTVYMDNDSDNDGQLDFEEFCKLYSKLLSNDKVKEQFSKSCLLRYKDGHWGIGADNDNDNDSAAYESQYYEKKE